MTVEKSTNIPHFQVIVVGAGPAGAISAHQLANAGVSVALLEKETLPRYKACGGGVTIRAQKHLDFPIDAVIERTVNRCYITSNFKNPYIKTYPEPISHMTMRDRLDELLAQRATQAGAKLMDGCKVSDITDTGAGYRLKTSSGDFTADYLIAADGANSIIRKKLEMPAFQRPFVAVEYETDGSPQALDEWRDMLGLDFGPVLGGYTWVFPKSDHFSIGAGGDIRAAKKLDEVTEAYIAYYKDQLGLGEVRKRTGHKIPIAAKGDAFSKGRTLFVGDAGGLADPLTGEGIYFAIASGKIAARTITDALQNGGTLMAYDHALQAEILPEIQMSKALLRVLDSSRRFWPWFLLKCFPPFWVYFCKLQRGEKTYMDLQRDYGPIGKIFWQQMAARVE